ncbi:hypothetical protein KR054_004365 [Drosophila jambulina]|nr:hypothetical protein KR054_004365 [Drosophila jambulina]
MWKTLHTIIWLVAIGSSLAEVGAKHYRRQVRPRIPPRLELDRYLSHEDMMQYLDKLALAYSDRLQLQYVGRSFEGRELRIAKVSNGIERTNKKVIFMDAALHAREWTTPITALYVINQLVVESRENAHLLTNTDWWILPLANPDGYEFSRNKNKWWRNTKTHNVNHCYGTNLNRNFGLGWGEGFPELKDPCNENYAGREPFSEAEARAVRDIMLQLVDNKLAFMYLSLHTANRSIFYPWVNEPSPIHNNHEHEEIARLAANRILSSTGTTIKPNQGYSYGGRIGGTSVDYAFDVGFPLAFVFEMSGKGPNEVEYKFFPPAEYIRYLVQESWVGIRAMAEKAIEMYPQSRPIYITQQRINVESSASSNWNYLNYVMGEVTSLMGQVLRNIPYLS